MFKGNPIILKIYLSKVDLEERLNTLKNLKSKEISFKMFYGIISNSNNKSLNIQEWVKYYRGLPGTSSFEATTDQFLLIFDYLNNFYVDLNNVPILTSRLSDTYHIKNNVTLDNLILEFIAFNS